MLKSDHLPPKPFSDNDNITYDYDNRVQWFAAAVILLLVSGLIIAAALTEQDGIKPATNVISLGECTVIVEQGVTLLKDCSQSQSGYLYKAR